MAGFRFLTSAKSEKLIGSCGHETSAYIPPNGGRPGPVGRRNIAKAKARACYDCLVASDELKPVKTPDALDEPAEDILARAYPDREEWTRGDPEDPDIRH